MSGASRTSGSGSRLGAYLLAAGSVALAYALQSAFSSLFPGRTPFIFYFPAVVAAAWYGGRGPGLLAAGLSTLSSAWLLQALGSLDAGSLANWVALAIFAIASASIGFAVGDLRDTQQKLADALEANRRLAAIVEGSDDAIIGKDLKGRIVSWNQAARRIFGYEEQEALGRSIEILMPPDRGADWLEILKRVAGGERVEHFETVRRRKDGRLVDVSVTVSPVHDAEGRIVGASKIVRDITAKKAVQRDRERTLELFLGTLGHDLRNPLNTIKISAVTLGRRAAELDQKVVERIVTSADRMARMIDQLLEFTKSRLGGGIEVHPQETDIASVCRAAVEELEVQHPGRIVLSTSLDLRGSWDADRIVELLSNLLSNALEYGSLSDPVRLTLCGDEDSVVMEVANHGSTIPESLLPVVFDPFQRGLLAESRRSKGLGLGLYIARQIARAHGGDISVRSSAPTGTAFLVTLPRRAVNAAS